MSHRLWFILHLIFVVWLLWWLLWLFWFWVVSTVVVVVWLFWLAWSFCWCWFVSTIVVIWWFSSWWFVSTSILVVITTHCCFFSLFQANILHGNHISEKCAGSVLPCTEFWAISQWVIIENLLDKSLAKTLELVELTLGSLWSILFS